MIQNHVDDQFSLALDGEMNPGEERAFQAHVAACSRCAEAFSEFTRSVRAIQRAPVPPIPASELEATVAVAFAELDGVGPEGGESSAIPFRAPRAGRGLPWPMWLSHAAAVLLGCILMFGAKDLFGGNPDADVQTAAVPQPKVVIREVKVPVEVVRKVCVEVPKEVIREVARDVIVEVPVEVPVTRRVPHPLQSRLDVALGVASNVTDIAQWGAQGLASALEFATVRENVRLAEAMEIRGVGSNGTGLIELDSGTGVIADGGQGGSVAAARDKAPRGAARERAAGALVVLRDGNRLSLRTRGAREEVVPALIDALDDPDAALASAAHGQLLGIRSRMVASGLDSGSFPTSNGRASAAFDAPIDRAGGLRGLLRQSRIDELDSPSADSADEWRAWWRSVEGGQ